MARRESFTAAADALGISRSVATRQVVELEEILGVQLLVRTTRKVSLTMAGQRYLEEVGDIVSQLARADEAVRRQQDTLKGRLAVSAPLSLGMILLPDAISRFRILYPEVELKLDLTDSFVDILADGYDMALRISGRPGDKSTIWRKICKIERLVAASPAVVARMGRPEKPDDLKSLSCLGYSNLAEKNLWIFENSKTGESRTVSPDFCFECNNGNVLAALAVNGEGVVVLPRFLIDADLESGRLVRLIEDWSPPEIWLTAFYPPYGRLPTKVETFTRFIEDVIRNSPAISGT